MVSDILHEKSVSKTISLPVWMWERLEEIAATRGNNRSSYPQEVLHRALDTSSQLPDLSGDSLPADVVAQLGRAMLRRVDLPALLEALEGADQPRLLTDWLEDLAGRGRGGAAGASKPPKKPLPRNVRTREADLPNDHRQASG